MLRVLFIVNGEEAFMDVAKSEILNDVVACVLAQTRNASRPAEEWETRHDNGVLLNPELSVHENNVVEGALLFLTLRLGAGG